MNIIQFPARFALLARMMGFPHTSESLEKVLGVSSSVLSEWYKGEKSRLSGQPKIEKHARNLAHWLHANGKHNYLAGVGRTENEMYSLLVGDDDAFIAFAAKLQPVPVPESVRKAPRQFVDAIAGLVCGYGLLYRFGTKIVERKQGRDEIKSKVTVLRRIPVYIKENDTRTNFLLYQDRYSTYGEQRSVLDGRGFVVCTSDFITIMAEDVDVMGSDLFFAHLKRRPVTVMREERPVKMTDTLLEGVILINGDKFVPTGAKVLLRRLSNIDPGRINWEDFAAKAEAEFEVGDADGDGKIELRDPKDDIERFDGTGLQEPGLNWAVNRLQIHSLDFDIPLE
ncbi:MAG: hypothetical protein ABL904_13895 [Hyphomicrobiaceae bacterium]